MQAFEGNVCGWPGEGPETETKRAKKDIRGFFPTASTSNQPHKDDTPTNTPLINTTAPPINESALPINPCGPSECVDHIGSAHLNAPTRALGTSERLISPGNSKEDAMATVAQDNSRFDSAFKIAVHDALLGKTTTIDSVSGKFKAVHDAKLARWGLFTSKNKRIGNRKALEDVVTDLEALDAGTHKSQFKDHTQPTQQLKASTRIASNKTVAYAPPTREGNYIGRGNKRKEETKINLNNSEKAHVIDQGESNGGLEGCIINRATP